jgi:hypothetical protein
MVFDEATRRPVVGVTLARLHPKPSSIALRAAAAARLGSFRQCRVLRAPERRNDIERAHEQPQIVSDEPLTVDDCPPSRDRCAA